MSSRPAPDPWDRAQELLDARRDPLAEQDLACGLDAATCADLARLARRLELLEHPPRLRPRASARRAAAMAALLLAALAPLALWASSGAGSDERARADGGATTESVAETPTEPVAETVARRTRPLDLHHPLEGPRRPDGVAAAGNGTPARVLDFEIVTETVRGGERVVTTFKPGVVERRHESRRPQAPHVIAWTHETLRP